MIATLKVAGWTALILLAICGALWTLASVAVPWIEYASGRETVIFRLLSPGGSQLFFLLVAALTIVGFAALIWRPAGRALHALSESESLLAQLAFAAIVGVAGLLWLVAWVGEKAAPGLDIGKELSKPAYLEWIARRAQGPPTIVPGSTPVCTAIKGSRGTMKLCQPQREYLSGYYKRCEEGRPDELRLAVDPEDCDEARYFSDRMGLTGGG